MTMLVYTLVLTLTLVVGEVVATSCTGGTVNGCSTVLPWVPFKKRFTPSCNRHDVCYGCMTMLLYALTLALTLVVGEVVANDCTGEHVDGCTTVVEWVPFKDRFTPSCNRHDICYGCGAKFGKSRLWCDDVFKKNMMKTCPGLLFADTCEETAVLYYKAAHNFGVNHYRETPKAWCEEEWVKSCL
ncbi:conodipine-P1-like [Haliotis rufescens]|uniref:conodipine-P1-like n=1 Tax=Haliotis rufescens TaxID=6454 RepID=UPI00201EC688|nr:conodipine-P1-like [Haliotis rufescens]